MTKEKDMNIEDLTLSESDVQPSIPPTNENEVKSILDSVKLKTDEEVREEKKKGKRGPTPKVTVSTKDTPDKTQELYEEFNAFLVDKADIIPDSGVKQVIPTGIDLLDAILGGGFAIGALNIVVGQPGSGKTMVAIQTMGNGQQIYNGDIIAAFLDSEEATTTSRMSNLGVRNPKIKPYNDITVEKVFKFIEGLCLFKEQKKIIDVPSIVIWDSIDNTLSQIEREAEDVISVLGYKSRLLSLLIPKYIAKLAKYNICLIAVNQLRDVIQIGPFTAAKELKFMTTGKDMPGGNILRYNAFQLLEMKVKSSTDPGKVGFEGIIAKVKAVKNKLFSPNVEIEIVGNFVTGFDNFWTNYNFLVETKRLQSGAWNYLITMPEKKFRTNQAFELYSTDQDFKAEFDKITKQAIQEDILSRNDV